jgi:hypothetical protein
MPPGSIWQPGEGFEELLEGIAENTEDVRAVLESLAFIRDALRTPILSDLEKEYGITGTNGLSEDDRRQRLLATIVSRDSNGTAEFMEDALRAAGFDVYVHVNNPPVDPTLFINDQYVTIFGNETAIFGRSDAIFGGAAEGELVVNGDVFYHPSAYSAVFGGQFAVFGNQYAYFGAIDAIENIPIEYEVPADSGYWGLFFFVGGQATRNGTTGELETIDFAQVPIERREELRRLIVKYKPMYSWGGLIVEFI